MLKPDDKMAAYHHAVRMNIINRVSFPFRSYTTSGFAHNEFQGRLLPYRIYKIKDCIRNYPIQGESDNLTVKLMREGV